MVIAPRPSGRTPSEEPCAKSSADVHWWYDTWDCGTASASAPGAPDSAVVTRPAETRKETLRAESRAPDHIMMTAMTADGDLPGTLRRPGPCVNALRPS